MGFQVLLTDDAARDLEDIYTYIGRHDGQGEANHVLDRIETVLATLSENPSRGAFPGELIALGLREFRQVFFKPYRIIYRIIEKNVYVLLIADGRRDMQTLLQVRLLQS